MIAALSGSFFYRVLPISRQLLTLAPGCDVVDCPTSTARDITSDRIAPLRAFWRSHGPFCEMGAASFDRIQA